MLKQQEILNQIAQLLHSSSEMNYEQAELTYKIIIDESRWTSFSAGFVIQGKKVPPTDFSSLQNKLEPLLNKLHSVMTANNGDWRKLTLVIDENRKVNVDFDYSEQHL